MRGQRKSGGAAKGSVQSIRRAVEVIRAIARIQRSGATLTRVVQATGLKRTTAFRILQSLTEERLLQYDRADHCYGVGQLAFELGLAAPARARTLAAWQRVVDRVAWETHLTTYLVARSDDEAVFLQCVPAVGRFGVESLEIGQRLPLGVGASSLAILASLRDEEVGRIICAHGARRDALLCGKMTVPGISKSIERTRREGFALSSGDVLPGVTGVGVAVLPRVDMDQIAISVSAAAAAINAGEARRVASVIRNAIDSYRGV